MAWIKKNQWKSTVSYVQVFPYSKIIWSSGGGYFSLHHAVADSLCQLKLSWHLIKLIQRSISHFTDSLINLTAPHSW